MQQPGQRTRQDGRQSTERLCHPSSQLHWASTFQMNYWQQLCYPLLSAAALRGTACQVCFFSLSSSPPRANETLCHCCFMVFPTWLWAMQDIKLDMQMRGPVLIWYFSTYLPCFQINIFNRVSFLCKKIRALITGKKMPCWKSDVFGLWLDHSLSREISKNSITSWDYLHRERNF